jgi:hypothetical protein
MKTKAQPLHNESVIRKLVDAPVWAARSREIQ